MNTYFYRIVLFSITIFYSCSVKQQEHYNSIRSRDQQNAASVRPFDSAWKFSKGNIVHAESVDFEDGSWRDLNVPHDWSIEDLDKPSQSESEEVIIGPFSTKSQGGISTGYTIGGTAWYRKKFRISPEDENKIISVRFDGVYMNADFWINGHFLGNHPNGYTPVSFDLTPYLNKSSENLIAVRVKNEGENSRWYSGSGIYRHVWLEVNNSIHIDRNTIFVTTSEVTEMSANINVRFDIVNHDAKKDGLKIVSLIYNPQGSQVAKTIANSPENETTFTLQQPELWSIDTPNLYLSKIQLYKNKKLVDEFVTSFGIRSISFSVDNGFLLNGKSILIKGGNLHHDNGPLGSAVIDRAEFRKVELMKSHGFNAIRTSHNPPSPALLDACDQLGMLVVDEAFDMWEKPKKPLDYHLYFEEWSERDLRSMILRDRNHPGIIMWSIGNEIPERADSSGLAIAKNLIETIKALDKTRLITQSVCSFWDNPGREWEDTEPVFELSDVGAYNYQWKKYEPDNEKFPNRIMMGGESIAMEVYENWQLVQKHPWIIGDFLWTGMDYLGEAAIGNAFLDNEEKSWPWFNGNCGDIDLCGNKKPQSYYRDVVWNISNIEMAVHAPIPEDRKEIVSFWGWPDEQQSWTWDVNEGQMMDVRVFTQFPKVQILLNDEIIEEKELFDSSRYIAEFKVPYKKGVLKAIGLLNGHKMDSIFFETAGQPAHIKLSPDRNEILASVNDLCYVTVEILDKKNILIPSSDLNIAFSVKGPAEIIGVGNGNPKDMKSFQSTSCSTFKGKCLVIIRPVGTPGEIILNANSGKLSNKITIGLNEE